MNTHQSNVEVTDKLLLGPKKCLEFIREEFPSKFQWLRLAEGAATKAASYTILGELPINLGLEWIRVAVEIYEKLADRSAADHATRVRLTEPVIAKRAQALAIWGASKDDPLLSPLELETRFMSIVDISPQQLREDVDFPRSAKVRTLLLITQFVEPLLQVKDMKSQLPNIAEYCAAANIVRKRAHSYGVVS